MTIRLYSKVDQQRRSIFAINVPRRGVDFITRALGATIVVALCPEAERASASNIYYGSIYGGPGSLGGRPSGSAFGSLIICAERSRLT
jgi:hypothetical protein